MSIEILVDKASLIRCFELLKKCEHFLDIKCGFVEDCKASCEACKLSLEIEEFLIGVGFQ